MFQLYTLDESSAGFMDENLIFHLCPGYTKTEAGSLPSPVVEVDSHFPLGHISCSHQNFKGEGLLTDSLSPAAKQQIDTQRLAYVVPDQYHCLSLKQWKWPNYQWVQVSVIKTFRMIAPKNFSLVSREPTYDFLTKTTDLQTLYDRNPLMRGRDLTYVWAVDNENWVGSFRIYAFGGSATQLSTIFDLQYYPNGRKYYYDNTYAKSDYSDAKYKRYWIATNGETGTLEKVATLMKDLGLPRQGQQRFGFTMDASTKVIELGNTIAQVLMLSALESPTRYLSEVPATTWPSTVNYPLIFKDNKTTRTKLNGLYEISLWSKSLDSEWLDILTSLKTYKDEEFEKLRKGKWAYPAETLQNSWGQLSFTAIQDCTYVDVNSIAYVKDIVEAAVKIRQGDISALLPISSVLEQRASKIGDDYLNSLYGMKLTVSDTKEIVSSVRRELEFNLKGETHSYRKVQAKGSLSCASWSGYMNYSVYYSPYDSKVTKVFKYLKDTDLYLDRSNSWDLVPFSFVVDWFLNVDTYLAQQDAVDYIKLLDIWNTIETTKLEKRVDLQSLSLLGVGETRLVNYEREVVKTLRSPTFFDTLSPSAPGHLPELAAIVYQQKRR